MTRIQLHSSFLLVEELLSHIEALDETHAMAVIVAEGGVCCRFPLLVLAAASPLIAEAAEAHMSCACKDVYVHVPDFSSDTIADLLRFMLCGELPDDKNDLVELCEALCMRFLVPIKCDDMSVVEAEEKVPVAADGNSPRQKPFQCSQCGKTFARSTHLTSHVRIHTGEKPLKCGTCDKRFSQYASLIFHTRMHRGEMPFSCDHCERKFRTNSRLTTHLRTHTDPLPFKCRICGERFPRSFDLDKHMHSHPGRQQYRCEHCGKCFVKNSHLTRHVRIHTGEKPFECNVCHKRFGQNYNLTSHMKSHADLPGMESLREKPVP